MWTKYLGIFIFQLILFPQRTGSFRSGLDHFRAKPKLRTGLDSRDHWAGFHGPPTESAWDMNPWKPLKYDFNHVIKELYFGDPLSDVKLPGVQTNLAGSKERSLIGSPIGQSEWLKMGQWECRQRDWKRQQHHMTILWKLSQQSIKINLETPRNRLRRPQVITWTWAWSRDFSYTGGSKS